jgi:hypothetical protein
VSSVGKTIFRPRAIKSKASFTVAKHKPISQRRGRLARANAQNIAVQQSNDVTN